MIDLTLAASIIGLMMLTTGVILWYAARLVGSINKRVRFLESRLNVQMNMASAQMGMCDPADDTS